MIDQESCRRTDHNLRKVPTFAMQDVSEDEKEACEEKEEEA
jgi:hypothetical protein